MNYVAEPLSRAALRNYARGIRQSIGQDTVLNFPVLQFLEALPEIINDPEFFYVVEDDSHFEPNIHAEYDCDNNCIRIRQSVYDGAYEGNGRDRMTIAHEIGHFMLIKVSGVKLQRNFNPRATVEAFRDPEWQAKCFAAELLIPAHLVRGMGAYEISCKCGVSVDAALYQVDKIK